MDEARIERANQWAELIPRENHFNFIKTHFLNHFVQYVRRFGPVPMYSTDIGELAHKEQIKEGYGRSNKIMPHHRSWHNTVSNTLLE